MLNLPARTHAYPRNYAPLNMLEDAFYMSTGVPEQPLAHGALRRKYAGDKLGEALARKAGQMEHPTKQYAVLCLSVLCP